jgi:hypothetical protein
MGSAISSIGIVAAVIAASNMKKKRDFFGGIYRKKKRLRAACIMVNDGAVGSHRNDSRDLIT